MQLIALITVSATCLVGQRTILVCFFQRTVSVVKIKKNVAVVKKSSFILCTQFVAQNCGNGISELQDFKILWGSTSPDPTRLKGALRPLVHTVGYSPLTSCLLQILLKPLE